MECFSGACLVDGGLLIPSLWFMTGPPSPSVPSSLPKAPFEMAVKQSLSLTDSLQPLNRIQENTVLEFDV